MNHPSLRKLARITLRVVAALILACGAIFLAVVQPGGSGVLASLRLPDGSEYLVTQRCNWSVEPYTVGFYMRSAGGPWGWCYIDHEATRWRDVAMTHDAASDTVTVTERGARRADLDRKRGAFRIHNGSISRELPAPQEQRLPEFAFQ